VAGLPQDWLCSARCSHGTRSELGAALCVCVSW
jgi:hypothetical protein